MRLQNQHISIAKSFFILQQSCYFANQIQANNMRNIIKARIQVDDRTNHFIGATPFPLLSHFRRFKILPIFVKTMYIIVATISIIVKTIINII